MGKSGIFLMLFIPQFIWAQTDIPGRALKVQIEKLNHFTGSDTAKVNLLNDVAWQYRNTNLVLAKKYAEEALRLASSVHFKEGISAAYGRIGIFCKILGEYDSSVHYLLKAVKIREELKDSGAIANAYTNLGSVSRLTDDSAKAIYYYKKSLEILRKAGKSNDLAALYINIANFYDDYKMHDFARKYYLQSLEIYKKSKYETGIAKVYNNIGASYFIEKKYSEALSWFRKSAALKLALNDEKGLASSFENIGATFANINKDSALIYFNEAIRLAKKTNEYLVLMETYDHLSEFYAGKKNFEKAYSAIILYNNLKDSVFNIEKTTAIAEMQTKYETEKKEQEIAILMRDQKISQEATYRQTLIRNFMGAGLVLILAIFIIVYRRWRFERHTKGVIQAEKQRSDELLRNILPQETADELKKYGKTTARNYDEVSVMFADVKGFTQIAEHMSADALVADLDMYFGTFDVITERFGLEKIKTIGDAYLCAGGMPKLENGTPEQTVMAALEMQKYVAEIKQERIIKNEPFFEIRIGIHTGPLVAGVVGIKKFAYDIWGDTVNTAARMEQYCEPGKVNISEFTYQKIKDKFRCTFRGEMEVKNKGMVAMYFVDSVLL